MLAITNKTRKALETNLRPHELNREVEKNFRSKLRELREKKGLTLAEMADKVGVPATRLSALERQRIISIHMAYRIADAMGWDWADLYEEI